MEMKTIGQTIGMLLDGFTLSSPFLSRGLDSEGIRASVPGNDASGATSVAGDERHGVDNVEDSDGGSERTARTELMSAAEFARTWFSHSASFKADASRIRTFSLASSPSSWSLAHSRPPLAQSLCSKSQSQYLRSTLSKCLFPLSLSFGPKFQSI